MKPHDRVLHRLAALSRNFSEYELDGVHLRERFPNPALVPLGKSHLQFRYHPDVWVRRKSVRRSGRKYDVYEVWDSEGEEKALAEVLRVAFTPEIMYYCVVCVNDGSVDPWTKRDATAYIRAMLDNLVDPKISFGNDVSVAEVNLETVRNDGKLGASLTEQLGF